MEADVVTPYGTALGEQSSNLSYLNISRNSEAFATWRAESLLDTLMRLSVIDGVVVRIVAGLWPACLKDNPGQFSRTGM